MEQERTLENANSSVQYYDSHAQEYCKATLQIDMDAIRARFLQHIPMGGRILDAGCGSGRDTGAFMKAGYSVVAFDASQKMAEFATDYTGQECKVLRFQDVKFNGEFDGVWSCAALLHVSKHEMSNVVGLLIRSLKNNGVAYFSFIEGNNERRSPDGRFYNSYTDESINELVRFAGGAQIIELWKSSEESSNSGKAPWLNVIIRRDPSR